MRGVAMALEGVKKSYYSLKMKKTPYFRCPSLNSPHCWSEYHTIQYFGGIESQEIKEKIACKWPTNVSIHFCTVINHFWAFFEKNEKKV